MSIDLNGSTQYGSYAGAVVSAYPFTMSGWFYDTSGSDSGNVVGIETDASADNRFITLAQNNEVMRFQTRTTSAGNADSSGNYTINNWWLVIAVATSATDREVFIHDGTSGTSGTNTTNLTPSGMDITTIGYNASATNYFTGYLAEIAIWNSALDATAQTDLRTKSPALVESGSLVSYWPLGGPNYDDDWLDKQGSNNMTATGAPTFNVEHPTLTYPSTSNSTIQRLYRIGERFVSVYR